MTALGLCIALPSTANAEPGSDGEALPTVTDEPPPAPEGNLRDDDQLERAMEAFARGSDNYNRAMYQEALADFLEAATLHASPDFQYNIALCYEKLNKPEEAISAFQTYLKTKRNVPDRANVEDRIQRLRTQLEAGKRPTDSPRPAARNDPAKPKDTPKRSGAGPLVIAGAVVTGLGTAVALGGGIGLGIAARRRSDDLDAVQSGGNPDDLTLAEARDLETSGKRLELVQIVTVAVGGAVALGGVAMLAVGLARKRQGKAGSKVAVAPSVGRTAVGIAFSGRF